MDKYKLITIPISKIYYDKKCDTHCESLAKSISEHGLINPIIVQKKPTGYQLISGKRRVEAFKKLGKKEILSICKPFNKFEVEFIPFIESFNTLNKSVFAKSDFIYNLNKKWDMSCEEISTFSSLSVESIKKYLSFHSLSGEQKEIIQNYNISLNQAISSLKILDYKIREQFLNYIASEKLNEEQSNRLLSKILQEKKRRTIKTSLPKDTRLYLNTINNTVKAMKNNNFNVTYTTEETPTYIECIVKIYKSV